MELERRTREAEYRRKQEFVAPESKSSLRLLVSLNPLPPSWKGPKKSRPNMTGQPPIWQWPPFAAQLLDPFAQGCELEGAGKLVHSITLLGARFADFPRDYLQLWSDEQFALLQSISDMLKDTMEVYKFEEKINDGDGLAMYVAAWGKKLDELETGKFVFLPAGWADGIGPQCFVVLLLERVSDNEFRLTLCNKGQGLEYHPCSVREAPKIKYQVRFLRRSP